MVETDLGDQTGHPLGAKTDKEEAGKEIQDPEAKVNMVGEETAVPEETDQEEEVLGGRDQDLDIPAPGGDLVTPSKEAGIGVEEAEDEGSEAIAEEGEVTPEAPQDSVVEEEGEGEKEERVHLGVEAEVQTDSTASDVGAPTTKLLPVPSIRKEARGNVDTVLGSTDLETAKLEEREDKRDRATVQPEWTLLMTMAILVRKSD